MLGVFSLTKGFSASTKLYNKSSFQSINVIPSVSQLKTNQPVSWISSTLPLMKIQKAPPPKDFIDFVDYKASSVRKLTIMKRRTNGRNNSGVITVRHRGGGVRRRYRIIDFKRDIIDTPAQVFRLEYDPNRTAPIALLTFKTGEQCYRVATHGMKPGDIIITSETAPLEPGNTVPLYRLPLGTFVHSVEYKPGHGAQLARAAGTSAQVLKQAGHHTVLKLKNGEIRQFSSACWATLGRVAEFPPEIIGKAGRNRLLGWRPTVRGTAMNPVDHPHGGGQGKTSGGRPSVSPWSKLTKSGSPTRSPRKINKNILIHRRKAKILAYQQTLNAS